MGLGPVPATAAALDRAGLKLDEIDLIELNEAFAAQVLACTREWGLGTGDLDRLNVNGSGISLGHPVGATGSRILATMLHEMQRREARYGLETMCIGGGQGIAAVFERAVLTHRRGRGHRSSRCRAASPAGVPGQCRSTASAPARRITPRSTSATTIASSA